MPAMKLTPNAAMRARDVSRPSAVHLAEAEAAEARGGNGREGTGPAERRVTERGGPELGGPELGRTERGDTEREDTTLDGAATATDTGRAGRPGYPRRRRGPRDGGRRGRSSR